jgi:hypothetical protein
MKYTNLIAASLLVVSGAFGQSDPSVDRTLAAVPRNLKEAATVIKFKPDNSYDVVKKGTSKLVCYDRTDQPGRQAYAVQCTVLANLPRVAQNRKFEAMTDKAAREAALNAAEADGSRVKPEYGSVWLDINGPDPEHAHVHTTIAVPGATSQSTGLPDKPAQGGAWIMNAGTSTAHIMTPGS